MDTIYFQGVSSGVLDFDVVIVASNSRKAVTENLSSLGPWSRIFLLFFSQEFAHVGEFLERRLLVDVSQPV